MKTELLISKEANNAGYFDIWISDQSEEEQNHFRDLVLNFFRNKIKLQSSEGDRETWETIESFVHPSGAHLSVVNDQFLGVLIESRNLTVLTEIYQQLKNEKSR